MKKSKKTQKRRPRQVASKAAVQIPVDMETLRRQLSDLVCADAAPMVSATIEQAREGHYQAMKYMFEMIGLYPRIATPDAPQEDSLAGMLLSRLGMGDEAMIETEQRNQQAKAGVRPRTP